MTTASSTRSRSWIVKFAESNLPPTDDSGVMTQLSTDVQLRYWICSRTKGVAYIECDRPVAIPAIRRALQLRILPKGAVINSITSRINYGIVTRDDAKEYITTRHGYDDAVDLQIIENGTWSLGGQGRRVDVM